ncbi:hypothetical protein ACFXKG_21095 [Streptomyces sp. NPDC059255]|uniref:hypothetical protein n=1 Tax=Streptomyces sp. NPDC059255 TaxID=3346793 RepID=UPI003684DDF0
MCPAFPHPRWDAAHRQRSEAGARGVYLTAFQYSPACADIIAPALFGLLFSQDRLLPWLAVGLLAALGAVLMLRLEHRLPRERRLSGLRMTRIGDPARVGHDQALQHFESAYRWWVSNGSPGPARFGMILAAGGRRYLMRSDVREAFEERLAGQDMGKGCLRLIRPENIDFDLLRDLLKATAIRPGKIC